MQRTIFNLYPVCALGARALIYTPRHGIFFRKKSSEGEIKNKSGKEADARKKNSCGPSKSAPERTRRIFKKAEPHGAEKEAVRIRKKI